MAEQMQTLPAVATETGLSTEKKDAARRLVASLGGSSFDNVFQMQETVSAIKMMVDIGKKPEDMLARTNFLNDTQALAAVRVLSDCIDFGDEVGAQELWWAMAARSAIGAERMYMLLKAVIGGNGQDVKPGGGSGFKGWMRRRAGMDTNG
jgi:hypothetical protein